VRILKIYAVSGKSRILASDSQLDKKAKATLSLRLRASNSEKEREFNYIMSRYFTLFNSMEDIAFIALFSPN